ncbi:MAG: hypothetical protein QNJ18_15780 [Xenococcaceae cyanobacterium MO_167.B52]|nr:hypothetical protein [Xenococcaceae cyanobacterium MO_167.B52]
MLPFLNYTLIQVQTRKLNPLILENIDRQIATDQVNWDLTMRVFNYQRDLTEAEITALKTQFLDNLETQKIINDENQLTNSQLFQQIDERDVLIANLKFQIEELKRILEEQKEENLAIADEFGLFAGEAKERIRELEDINFTQNERIEALETQLDDLLSQLDDSELDLLDSREALTEWEIFTGTKGTDLTDLQFEFANFDWQNAPEIERENKVNETRARFTTIYDYSLSNANTGGSSGGGFPQSARDSLTTTQNKQIELTAKLAGIDPTTITGFPVPDYQVTRFDNPFDSIIDSLLPQITQPDTTTTGEPTDVNLEEFSNNFDNKFEAIAATLAGLTATINTIDLNTNPTNLSTTVGNAVCSTTAPTGCMTQNVTNPLSQGQQGISNKLNDIASTLSAAFGAGNAIANQAIFDVVTATNNIVSKGWASTAIDKTLNAANFALSLHNAMMLSTNIAETILDVLTVILDIGNVTDASGNPIDVGDWLKEKIEAVVKNLVGARNYTELSIKLTAANRIYQAGMNIIDNVTDLMDTAMDLDEYTGENISRIGNALRASGVVSFDAYDEMLEDLDHRKFSKWLRRLEQAEDATDDIYSIADSIRDIKEIGQDLRESREEFNTTITDTQALLKEQETELDREIDNLSEPTITDEARG